jgi:hypothetical protein
MLCDPSDDIGSEPERPWRGNRTRKRSIVANPRIDAGAIYMEQAGDIYHPQVFWIRRTCHHNN